MKSRIALKNSVGVVYQTQIINPDGSIAKSNPPKKNLILDCGLDLLCTNRIVDCFTHAVAGTGTTPTNRDSGTTTASQSGTTVTASGNFFEAADVGRIIKYDSGEEYYITSFTSATEVEVNTSATVAASEFTIWYVNEIAHGTEVKRTSTYVTGASNCSSVWNGTTLTHKRTFDFSIEAAPVTYTEIGWSKSSGNLLGRDLIPGGDSLSAGQQYRVILQVIITPAPIAKVAISDVSGGTWNTAGEAVLCTMTERFFSMINSADGNATNTSEAACEPYPKSGTEHYFSYRTSDFTLPAAISETAPATTFTGFQSLTKSLLSYTTGSFYRDKKYTFTTAQGNATWYGFTIGNGANPVGQGFSVKFTTPLAKANTHTLALTVRFSVGRTLVN